MAMFKSAALLILTKFNHNNNNLTDSSFTTNFNFERELLHEINLSVCNVFTVNIVQCAIDCWSWLISSRPDLEPLVIEEMLNAWQMSFDWRLGMFAPTHYEPHPLAKSEKDILKPNPPKNTQSHRVWIKYLQERLDIAKYKSEFELELFFNLMHKCLSFPYNINESSSSSNNNKNKSNDDTTSGLNRHVNCVGLRFRLLNMAISLVQSPHTQIPNTIAKWILRERIYFTALDYFATRGHRAPTQQSHELIDDIRHVLEFWNRIVAEKKYLKEENFLLVTNQMQSNMSASGGSGTPIDGGSMSGLEMTNLNPLNGGNNLSINPALGNFN